MTEAARRPVSGKHRVLNGVVRVLGGAALTSGHLIEPGPVPGEEFAEGLPVPAEVGGEQCGVGAGIGLTVAHNPDGMAAPGSGHFTLVSAC